MMSFSQAAAFSTADYNLMSAAQQSALAALSPIILDLDGNGVGTTSAADGVNFDLAARLRLSYRFQHMSNGSLARPNPGLNLHMVGFGVLF